MRLEVPNPPGGLALAQRRLSPAFPICYGGKIGTLGLLSGTDSYRTSSSDVSDIGECQRTGSLAVDVREAIFHREAGG